MDEVPKVLDRPARLLRRRSDQPKFRTHLDQVREIHSATGFTFPFCFLGAFFGSQSIIH